MVQEQILMLTFGVFFVTAVTLAAVAIFNLWISLVLGYIFCRWADDKHPIETQAKVETGRRQPEEVKPNDELVNEEEVKEMMEDRDWNQLFNL